MLCRRVCFLLARVWGKYPSKQTSLQHLGILRLPSNPQSQTRNRQVGCSSCFANLKPELLVLPLRFLVREVVCILQVLQIELTYPYKQFALRHLGSAKVYEQPNTFATEVVAFQRCIPTFLPISAHFECFFWFLTTDIVRSR